VLESVALDVRITADGGAEADIVEGPSRATTSIHLVGADDDVIVQRERLCVARGLPRDLDIGGRRLV
jgi:hypothetical protein